MKKISICLVASIVMLVISTETLQADELKNGVKQGWFVGVSKGSVAMEEIDNGSFINPTHQDSVGYTRLSFGLAGTEEKKGLLVKGLYIQKDDLNDAFSYGLEPSIALFRNIGIDNLDITLRGTLGMGTMKTDQIKTHFKKDPSPLAQIMQSNRGSKDLIIVEDTDFFDLGVGFDITYKLQNSVILNLGIETFGRVADVLASPDGTKAKANLYDASSSGKGINIGVKYIF